MKPSKRAETVSSRRPVDGRSVWDGKALEANEDWIDTFSREEGSLLLSALDSTKARGLALQAIRRDDFDIPQLRTRFRRMAEELESGRGFLLIRGLSLDGLSVDDCKKLFWGIGMQIGVPMAQNKKMEFLTEVKDVGEKLGEASSRAYRAPGPLRFHTDQADILGLMCINEPISGGLSRVVSSGKIHNEILARRPDLLDVLYRTYPISRQSEQPPGAAPWYERPLYDWREGHFTSYYTKTYIESAQRLEGVAPITPAQQEALDLVADLAEQYELQNELRRGDIEFFNCHVTYHSRTSFQDHSDPVLKRTLLRLWLSTPISRPLPRNLEFLWGSVAAGDIRGGIEHATGQRSAFASWADAGWSSAALAQWMDSARP